MCAFAENIFMYGISVDKFIVVRLVRYLAIDII